MYLYIVFEVTTANGCVSLGGVSDSVAAVTSKESCKSEIVVRSHGYVYKTRLTAADNPLVSTSLPWYGCVS